jgi:hypothetical protein
MITNNIQSDSKVIQTQDIGIILFFVLIQWYWISAFISLKVALLNVLPALVFIGMWYFFAKNTLSLKYSRLYFIFGFLITLRLPVTVLPQLEALNWLLYLSMISLIWYKFFKYFQEKKQITVLYLTIAIILLNSFTHMFLDSPLTYSFRTLNHEPSNYISQKDNDTTWECSYEYSNLPVHCDMRHFIPSEKIFTEPDYDPSFSVFLTRFFYGYLNSLVGVQGHRWFMSFSLNIFLWISACIAIYRIGEIVNLTEKMCKTSMLCCASSWGFVHFVAQPSPHTAAFAFSAIILWATLELIHEEFQNPILLALLIISGSLMYDVYPLILISTILLLVYKRVALGILIPILSIALSLIWKYVSLQRVLGTLGNITHISSPSSNITYSFQNWIKAIVNFDLSRIWQFIANGFMSYLYGGMIFGAIASTGLLIYLVINNKEIKIDDDKHYKLLFNISACFCGVILTAMFFVAAQSEIWSPTKFIPRFAFYLYPINTIAIAFFSDKLINRWSYVIPVLTFMVANSTIFKLASMSVFFEYGLVGLYWQ